MLSIGLQSWDRISILRLTDKQSSRSSNIGQTFSIFFCVSGCLERRDFWQALYFQAGLTTKQQPEENV
jgi:hypothetical protein